MDKIDSLGESISYKQLKKKNKKKDSGKVTKFGSMLNRIKEKEYSAAVEPELSHTFASDDFSEMLEEISDFGETLSEHPTLENVKKYKEKVKHFIAFLVKNNLEIAEKISGRNILKKKKYMIINVIDKKLEELAKTFIMEQANSLKILEKVEEINGLLVDLLQ